MLLGKTNRNLLSNGTGLGNTFLKDLTFLLWRNIKKQTNKQCNIYDFFLICTSFSTYYVTELD